MSMLPANLAAELHISREEMDIFAADMYSVLPGCNQVKLATAGLRSAIANIMNTTTVEGHELYGVWQRMHLVDQLIVLVEKWFGDDMEPTEQGSPKDNILLHINRCLDAVGEIDLAVQDYGNKSQLVTEDILEFRSRELLKVVDDILKFEPRTEPLLRVEDVHEGMELPSSPSSPLLASRTGERLDNEESPLPPAMGLFQVPEGSDNIQPSSSSQPESHDETWTFRMV
ncbi:hypothetical protein CEP54_003722 [Fusarium duplospermum]|uniref:Uncharacterized protein n=1 Tax=Fusarium duplospermum TaxID=1325734 RepID=A0A428QMP3_9HYPO|nr:hypothetical protein CEP54_003722 [Fusarium duplospermum]